MQPARSSRSMMTNGRFSTLYGSKWVASARRGVDAIRRCGFSTLYGSKWVATTARFAYNGFHLKFQYPLRVEVGCNGQEADGVVKGFGFQYPLRVEVGCNVIHAVWHVEYEMVSVPSTGRSGLQPDRRSAGIAHRRSFSTLYGSKWVATPRVWRDELAHKVSRFSTLYGSKWVATLLWNLLKDRQYEVSVPSTGRSGLQVNKIFCLLFKVGVSVPSTGRSGLQVPYGANIYVL